VWVIVSPWVVLGSLVPTSMVISNVITGGLIVLLGLGTAALGATAPRRAYARH
jgi:SPW repeat